MPDDLSGIDDSWRGTAIDLLQLRTIQPIERRLLLTLRNEAIPQVEVHREFAETTGYAHLHRANDRDMWLHSWAASCDETRLAVLRLKSKKLMRADSIYYDIRTDQIARLLSILGESVNQPKSQMQFAFA